MAARSNPQNGWGVTWRGPVTVNSNTTLRADYSMEFSGNISGAGGFTKTSGNTVTLSGSNTYTGANVVQAGTLSCSKSASLGSGALSISNGAVVNLNYSGTRKISALTLGGTNMAPGVYGSTSSSATNKDSHFTGTGTVTVNNVNEPPLLVCAHVADQRTACRAAAARFNATAADPARRFGDAVSFYADRRQGGRGHNRALQLHLRATPVAGVHSLLTGRGHRRGQSRQLTSAVANVTLAFRDKQHARAGRRGDWRYFRQDERPRRELGASNSFNDVLAWSNGPARLRLRR